MPASNIEARQGRGTCRTCTNCRRKKIRCDGQRPRCHACQAKGTECTFPQDARKSATRLRKADVLSLQHQLDALRSRFETSPTFSRPLPQNHGPAVAMPLAPPLAPSSLTSQQHPAPDDEVDDGVDNEVENELGNEVENELDNELDNEVENELGNEVENELDNELDNEVENELDEATSTAKPGSVASTSQRYGLTSLLHDHSPVSSRHRHQSQSPRPPMASGTRSTTTASCMSEPLSDELCRAYVVSNAALGRQAESTLRSNPSLLANIDFDLLPADAALHLLDLHWNRQHMSYLLTYRPAIMDSLIRNGPHVNSLLLNAIYLQSSLYSDRPGIRTPFGADEAATGQVNFYARFKALLPTFIDKPSIPTIVALLTCGSCLVPHGQQSAGWVFCGMAYRMMIDIGIHLDSSGRAATSTSPSATAIEMEMANRLYWGAYVGDKFQSLFLGRSPALHRAAATVSRNYLDSYEEMEVWAPYVDPQAQAPLLVTLDQQHAAAYVPRPAYALSTFRSLLELCDIAADMIEAFYAPSTGARDDRPRGDKRNELRAQLSQWHSSLPSWLHYKPEQDHILPPHQITIHTTYWTLIILTEQALLRGDEDGPALDADSLGKSKRLCVDAALQIWLLVAAYRKAFTLRRAQYGLAYATYCAVVAILQQTDQDCEEYIECIRFFWTALLEYERGCNHGLKRPLRLLRSLMRRMNRLSQLVSVDESNNMVDRTDAVVASSDNLDCMDFRDLLPAGNSLEDFLQPWDESLCQGTTTQGLFNNNTVFGIADDSLMGTYM
ncbi:uncharacterized protein CCOS01_13539 [Colletotrichum costaricense]|uniref:Zn(2)-C6 fungal-type domain-containing protein n=1 Tax=Colletotrichum costaricense TaxID=1209916 RepID=A0AAJ0DVC9_9PEZI|nr:uncharacterized protein CCOS01_13539 [Colletotrichum costaricense]KAK1515346.1 hypothetical protein CCOS01_13539 [Colletotrichum costaricense]